MEENKMQQLGAHHLWTMNKPITKKQGNRKRTKCKNLINVVCEQWTNQQQENKMIEKNEMKEHGAVSKMLQIVQKPRHFQVSML